MAKFSILAGSTSQSVNIFIQNSSVTTGAGLTGLVFNTSGLTAYYAFTGANGGSNAITLATLSTATSAYSSGGFIAVDGTNMPGVYRLDLPNAVIAASKGQTVVVYLQGATNMAPCVLEIELTAINNQSTAFGLSIAKTTNITGFNDITAAAAATGVWQDTTAGDFTISGSIGKSLFTSGNAPGAASGLALVGSNMGTITGGTVTTVTNQLTAAQIATGVWQDSTAGDFTAASSIGKALYIANVAPGASGGHLISGSNSGTTTLGALTVTGATTCTGNVSMAAGLTVTQSTTNGSGISITGNGTGHGILSTSGSGATGDGIKAISAATNGNGLTLTHAGTGADLNATTTPLTLAKTTNITGFNDIAATAIVSSGAITTSGGAVSTVTTTTTATNLTNAPTAGDFTATMKTSLNAATPASVVGAVGSVTGNVGGNVTGSVGSVIGGVTVTTNNDKTGYALTSAGNNSVATAVLTNSMTESYPTPGAAITLTQGIYDMVQQMNEKSISGTTLTIKKRDQATSAKTFTLNDATNPSSITEAT